MSQQQPNLEQMLRQLRLTHAAGRLDAKGEALAPALVVALTDLLQAEIDGRRDLAQQRLQQQANLPEPSASLEEVWHRPGRNLDRTMLRTLAEGAWIERGQHVLITGATGLGKTWLACALGQAALRAGRSVLYRDVPDLLAECEVASATRHLAKFRRRIERMDLLILDDWGVEALAPEDVQVLRRILHYRSMSRSIVLVSPRMPDEWRAWLGGYVGDALVDRVEAAAVQIDLRGPSLRRAKRPSEVKGNA